MRASSLSSTFTRLKGLRVSSTISRQPLHSTPQSLLHTRYQSFSLGSSVPISSSFPFFSRPFSSLPSVSRCAQYSEHGIAENVIRLVDLPLPPLGPTDVLIQFLCSPINPADINMIEGNYSIKPPLPAIGGNEGVAKVVATGKDVTDLHTGDWVVPSSPGFGTWRDYAVCKEDLVDYIDNDIPPEVAAVVSVNPCTAYRMLHDFVSLKPGDVVIQNGANSGVGQSVIQLSRNMHVRTINIIRDRPNLKETVEHLKSLGADIVVTEEVASSRHMKDQISSLSPPKLGLNCVGGSSSADMARLMADGGEIITYGGMSRKPVTVPTGRLIFNNLTFRGFWLSRWTMQHLKDDHQSMIHTLTRLMKQGKLTLPVDLIPFEQFDVALKTAQEGYRENKIVLKFT